MATFLRDCMLSALFSAVSYLAHFCPRMAASRPSSSCSNDSTLIGSPVPHPPDTSPSDTMVFAILTGNVTQAMSLATSGVTVAEADSWATYEACIQGPEMMCALSANPNIQLNRVIPGQMGDKTLHFLLRTPASRFIQGKVPSVKCLVDRGANPLDCDRRGNTALHILAAHTGIAELDLMAAFLGMTDLIGSADLECKNTLGQTALIIATINNNAPCRQLLLDHGADPLL